MHLRNYMMQLKHVCVVFFLITLTSIDGIRVRKKPTTQAVTGKRVVEMFPMQIRVKDYPDFKIPTSHFCSKMVIKPAGFYVVLPWWFHYCEGLKDRQMKHERSYNLAHYRHILNQVNTYKNNLKRV